MPDTILQARLIFSLNSQASLDPSETHAFKSIELHVYSTASVAGLFRVNPEQTIADAHGEPDPNRVEWYVNGVAVSSGRSDFNMIFELQLNDIEGGSVVSDGIVATNGFFSASIRSTGQFDQLLRGQIVVPLERVTDTDWYALLSRFFWPGDNKNTDPNANPQLTHLLFTPAGLYAVGRMPADFFPVSIGMAPLVALYAPQNAGVDTTIPAGAWVLDGFPFRVEGTDLPTAGSLVQVWGKDFLSFKRSSGASVRFLDDIELPPEPERDTFIVIRRQQSSGGPPEIVWSAERFRVDIVIATPNSREAHFRPAALKGHLVWNSQDKKWHAFAPANQPVLATWKGGPAPQQSANLVTLRMYGNVPPGPLPGGISNDEDASLEFNENLVATDVPTVPSVGGTTSAWLCTEKGWVAFQRCTAGAETVPGFGDPAALNGALEVENIFRDLIGIEAAVGLETEVFALPTSAVELALERWTAADPGPLAVVFRVIEPIAFLNTPPFWLSPDSIAGGAESQTIPDLLERPVLEQTVSTTESDPSPDDFLKRFVSSSFMTAVTSASKTDVRLRASISRVNNSFVFAFASDFLADVIVWTPPTGMAGMPLAQWL